MNTPCTMTLAVFATLAVLASPIVAHAEAGGTVKGAAVGAVAGHVMGGHAKSGAVVGAVVGHHERAKANAAKQ
jgi:hypothetical protein